MRGAFLAERSLPPSPVGLEEEDEEEELDGAVTGLGFGLVPVAAAPASLVTLGVWERAEFF